jgi:hypothetical protein
MSSTVPGLVFGGELTAEEYRSVFNDKTDWLSMSTEQKIEYRAKLRKLQLIGAVKLISLDKDIETELRNIEIPEKKRLRELDSNLRTQAKRVKTQEINQVDAEKLAADALGLTLDAFREKMGTKPRREKCDKHNLEFTTGKDGVTCPLCDVDEEREKQASKRMLCMGCNRVLALCTCVSPFKC